MTTFSNRERNSNSARILVADDQELNRALFEELLIAQGYDVVTARDGISALEEFKRSKPDLVLLELEG